MRGKQWILLAATSVLLEPSQPESFVLRAAAAANGGDTPSATAGSAGDRREAEGRAGAPSPRPFGPEVFQARRQALMKHLAGGVAVLYGNEAGSGEEFEQDPYFYYLTGIEDPGAAIVLAPEEGGRTEALFLTPRNPESERWTGERPPLGSALERETGFGLIYRSDRLAGFLREAALHAKKLYLLRPPSSFTSPVSRELETLKKIQERTPGVSIEDRSPTLVRMRQIKSEEEIALMRRAIEITGDGIRAAMRVARPGRTEYDVKTALETAFREGGARRNAFSSICATGKNTTILHYTGSGETIREGDLFLLDVGAEVEGYDADVSRTFPVSGTFTPEQRKIYELVLAAQAAGIAAVKPGARYREDVHAAARKVLVDAGYGDAFPHQTGHYVGLETHDVGDHALKLEPGMVITVEPGIYLPDQGLGVRIEDMVLVTKNGNEVLTRSIPKSIPEMEAWITSP